MTTATHGGTAFPTPDFTYAGQRIPGSEGMALRDYFAAKAMHADMIDGLHEDDFAFTAARAYKMADSMLEARTK